MQQLRDFCRTCSRVWKRVSPSVEKLLCSRTMLQLACWYFILLIPTVALKYHYLNWVYSEPSSIASILEPLTEGSSAIPAHFYIPLFFATDALQVFACVLFLFVIGSLLFQRRVNYLMSAAVMLCLLVGFASYWTSRETGMVLNYDMLQIGFHWAKNNPDAAMHFVFTPRKLALAVLALLWAAAPILLAKKMVGPGQVRHAVRWSSQFLFLALLVASLAVPSNLTAQFAAAESPFRGYWTSAVASFLDLENQNPFMMTAPSFSQIKKKYEQIVYPRAAAARPKYLFDPDPGDIRPRHVVIVSLETAPRKYYPIVNNPSLPTFHRMSQQAIVSDQHYSTSPFTLWSIYSILSGNYFPGATMREFRTYHRAPPDGLPSVLKQHGYLSTYIATFLIDWLPQQRHSRLLRSLGFDSLADPQGENLFTIGSGRNSYETFVSRERRTFEIAFKRILSAEQKGKKAFITIETILGHYPWKAKPEDKHRPSSEKVYLLAASFDEIFGQFLASLEKHNLTEETIIVVTGDHGLRFGMELESLGEERFGHVQYGVPFLLYAPGLLETQVRLPYVTTHVDIAPTLLQLLGVRTESLLFHGHSMLDERLRERVSFMMSAGLSPVDMLHYKGCFFLVNKLAGRATLQTASAAGLPFDAASSTRCANGAFSNQEAYETFERAKTVVAASVSYFLHRQRGPHQAQTAPVHLAEDR